MSNAKVTEVIDVLDGTDHLNHHQRQTMAAANRAQESIDGCRFVVLLAFHRNPETGGWRVDTGVAGTGPTGFGRVVSESMHAAAEQIGPAMTRQERPHGEPS